MLFLQMNWLYFSQIALDLNTIDYNQHRQHQAIAWANNDPNRHMASLGVMSWAAATDISAKHFTYEKPFSK